MRFHILGCSGGLGGSPGKAGREGKPFRTSSFLVDDDILIDAGTGVEDLSVDALRRIDHVFLSHSHLDHICALPLMLDTVGSSRQKPVVVHALSETIRALKEHIFNWVIWPDFTEIPHFERPWMVFRPFQVGQNITIGDRTIRPISANHTVPAVGFHIRTDAGSLVYSGDTLPNDEFWRTVNGITDLRHLILETAFSNRERDLAVTAKHLYPVQLSAELDHLCVDTEIHITHLKPSDRALIVQEIQAWAGRFQPHILQTGDVLVID
ncbi:MAG: 3',5'-cyclic-nucleotide phosphodiesterase [Lautropia sp.]|nr:3',5'-cyclic-nucleotide phosphodiesterase [Lautropia sp.]